MKINARALVLAACATPVGMAVTLVPDLRLRLALGALVFVGLAVVATVLAPKAKAPVLLLDPVVTPPPAGDRVVDEHDRTIAQVRALCDELDGSTTALAEAVGVMRPTQKREVA